MSVRRIFLVLASAAASATLFVACGSGGDDDASSGPAGDGDTIEIKMLDNFFKPSEITVKAGTTVTFELPNVGKLPHNMHIASLRGVYRESPWLSEPELSNPGDTGYLKWEVPAEPGVYKFRCDIHEAEMTGKITVE